MLATARYGVVRLLLVATLAIPVGCAVSRVSAGTHGPPLEEARRAFMRHEIRETREILGAALEGVLDSDERAEAERMLATLAWRFDRDAAAGRAHLSRALETRADRSESFAEWARLETSFERFVAARAAADSALASADGSADSTRAVARYAAATLAEARTAGPGGAALPYLPEALARLVPLVARRPDPIGLARQQLEIALRLDDGPAALAGWRAYYAAALGRDGPLPEAHRALARVLPDWAGAGTTASDRAAVVEALAASGLYREARLMALGAGVADRGTLEDPEIASIVAYADFLRRIEQTTDEYYRRTALGEGDPEAWRAALIEAAEALWPSLAWHGEPPAFDPDTSLFVLAERFAAEITLGTTAGYEDLHYGHVVIDERRTIEQYGEVAELRFVALDGIVSNGFQSWAWDGRAAHGGWATDEAILQVRPGYTGGIFRVWRMLADPLERAEREAEIARRTAADWRRAEVDPCAYLPGLRDRIHHQGLVQLRDSLAATGLTGDALRDAFLVAYDRARVESSIFAHEGRHVIDRRLLGDQGDPAEREYRAKLSEVAFAPQPRLALRAIISPDAGDATPHGQANQRILCELVDWMEDHAREIDGLDRQRPLLPQLTLLTDRQLREAFRSLDPLARRSRDQR